MKTEEYLKNCKVIVSREIFAVAKVKRAQKNPFATIIDKKEITIILDQTKLVYKDAIEVEHDWKMITFDMILPFGLVGFLAKISGALAKENISIFAISAYSTDHLLVKEKDLKKALVVLKKLGCIV